MRQKRARASQGTKKRNLVWKGRKAKARGFDGTDFRSRPKERAEVAEGHTRRPVGKEGRGEGAQKCRALGK